MGAKIFSLKSISTGVVLMCLLASASKDKLPAYTHHNPPGVVKIAENLYYDQSEIGNVHYREYMFWLKYIFGENSDEYKAALPDTLVWLGKDSCLRNYVHQYYTHPAYDFYPLVGITQRQAENFSKWRADRVFEKILVEHAEILRDTAQNRNTYFSIERYYAGQLQNIKPNKHFKYYPNYRLPSEGEWKLAAQYEDSMERKYSLNCSPNINVSPCNPGKISPTRPVEGGCNTERKNVLYNLHGNVGEWTSEKGISIGGGWADDAKVLSVKDTFQISTPNAETGFRNVCEWKEFVF
jgi:formylglycine-generating enzyme required for sulfatase activity